MSRLEPIESAVYSLIKEYVMRQEIVLEALNDMRPDIVRRNMENYAPKDISDATVDYYLRHPVGMWDSNDEWDYFIHGHGCRLTHKKTAEPIEWDTGDLKRFDKNWFLNRLMWRLESSSKDETIEIIRRNFETSDNTREALNEIISPILTRLSERNLLSDSRNQIHYRILEN